MNISQSIVTHRVFNSIFMMFKVINHPRFAMVLKMKYIRIALRIPRSHKYRASIIHAKGLVKKIEEMLFCNYVTYVPDEMVCSNVLVKIYENICTHRHLVSRQINSVRNNEDLLA